MASDKYGNRTEQFTLALTDGRSEVTAEVGRDDFPAQSEFDQQYIGYEYTFPVDLESEDLSWAIQAYQNRGLLEIYRDDVDEPARKARIHSVEVSKLGVSALTPESWGV